ncbi:MAG: M15 family metallopeptidase [Mycobacteriales bacterium]
MVRLRILSVLALTTLLAVLVALPGSATAAQHDDTKVVRKSPAGPHLPHYVATIHTVSEKRLGKSWRKGCPVGPRELRLLRLNYVGFDGRVHRGELIVADAVAREVADIFGDLYFQRFPIARMETVDKYGADDDKSMAANNTSAFNCRPITGGTAWSNHSYGRAIDINTVQNPYISGSGVVSPPAGKPFADRSRTDPGMIHHGDNVYQTFIKRSWAWGGDWDTPKDYQHFEKPRK